MSLIAQVTAPPPTTAPVSQPAAPVAEGRCRVLLIVPDVGEDGTLKPGRDYILQLLIAPVLEGEQGNGIVKLTGPVSLKLQWVGAGEGTGRVTVEQPEIRLRPEDLAGAAGPLQFTATLKVGADVVVLGKLLMHAESASGKEIWSERTLGFTQDQEAPEEFTKKCDAVELLWAPESAEKLAVLFVESRSDQRLSLLGFQERAGQLPNIEVPLPPQNLTDLGQGPKSWDIFSGVRAYSKFKVQKLIGWLKRVLAFAGPDATLVIYENNDTRVPWEMLEVEDLKPLGGEISVVRWLMAALYEGSLKLETGRVVHQGSVLAYVDEVQLTHTELERQALKSSETSLQSSLNDLFAALNPLEPGVALVFLACHGVIASDQQKSLLKVQDTRGEIRTMDLMNVLQPEGPRPMVFVNACHSARMVDDCSGGYDGLPLVCLAQFARSFIGTLGPVDFDVAGEVGGTLLEAARKEATPIPKLLQALRWKAAEARRKAPLDPETLRKYVHTFLYVFYGSPDTQLELSRGSDA